LPSLARLSDRPKVFLLHESYVKGGGAAQMKTHSVCWGRRTERSAVRATLLILAVLSVLALSACDGEATYTPPPPTAIQADTPTAVASPASAEQSAPTQAVASTPTPFAPPASTPEDYPVPPTLEPVTPQAYPESSGGS
jgi:hypothetical protein